MNYIPTLRLVLPVVVMAFMSGCIVISSNRTEHRSDPACKAEVGCVDDQTTITEINTVRKLDFSSQRADQLSRVARRPGIGPNAQVCLVDTTFETLEFENEKMRVLNTLISNPTLSADGKSRILERLDELEFSNNRQAILRALDKHGPVIVYADEPVGDELIVGQAQPDETQPSESPAGQAAE